MPSRKTNAANLYGGGAAPLQFTHTQMIAASTWTIDHNFGVPGSLRAVAYDNGGIWMPIVGIQAVGENQAVVTFDQPRTGRVDVFADDAYEFNAVKVHSQIDLAGLELTVSQQGRLLANGARLVTENELGANGLSPLFSDVRGKPTTLAGYGITDGVQSLIEPSSELAWKDITSELFARTSGSAAPSLSLFRGMLYAWQFSPTTNQSLYATFHVPHDYAPGTPIHLHVHWSETGASDNTKVRWGFEYSIAKGHGQEPFPASSFIYAEQSCIGPYYHMVAETAAISSPSIEPDALILVRMFRDASHANDTCPNGSFAFTCDVHYQSDRHGTLNRAPNFYMP